VSGRAAHAVEAWLPIAALLGSPVQAALVSFGVGTLAVLPDLLAPSVSAQHSVADEMFPQPERDEPVHTPPRERLRLQEQEQLASVDRARLRAEEMLEARLRLYAEFERKLLTNPAG
jgi:hypothetical protein